MLFSSMTEAKDVKIKILCESKYVEIEYQASLDDKLEENWVPRKLAVDLKLSPSSPINELTEERAGQELRSIGSITFAWYRNDDSNSNVYTEDFYVTNGSIPVILGSKLLSAKPEIRNPTKSVLPLYQEKEKTKGT